MLWYYEEILVDYCSCTIYVTRLDSFCAGIVWAVTARGSTSPSHTLNIVPPKLAERVWCTQFQSSLLNIYFRHGGFQFSLLLIYFRDGPKRCSQHTKVWQKIYPIYVSVTLLSRSTRRTTIPVCEQKHYPVCFSRRRKNYSEEYEQSLLSTQCFSSDLV